MVLKMGLLQCAATALVVSAGLAGRASAAGDSNAIVTAYTTPMDQCRSQMTFRQAGLVKEVMVKKGDHVKKGQVLIKLDDSVEMAQWKSLEIQGNSTLQEQAARAEMKEKQIELDRYTNLVKNQASSPLERDRAELEVEIAKKKMEVAQEEQKFKTFDAQARKAQVDQMQIVAPFDGVVEKVGINVGELATSDANKPPAITLVQSEQLNVVMNLPNRQADKLQTGDTMQVRYSENGPWISATVDFISPASDAKSFTRMVTLMMNNPSGMTPGHEVQVKLPDKAVEEERTASVK